VIEVAVVVVAFVVAWTLTAIVRRYALSAGMLDVPNPRSSHVTPTPRGGGMAIVGAVCLASAGLFLAGWLDWRLVAVCWGPGLMVALVGYADDRRGLSPGIRLLVHLGAAAIAVGLTWPWPGILAESISFQVLLVLAVVVGIGWMINLFNFMDGIDGLAGSEAVFVLGAAALLIWLTGGSSAWVALLGAGAAAAAGFLWWNWPPARIFMGDVGSGFVGFLVGALALLAWHAGQLHYSVWLILSSLFVADASVTLVRRMLRRERWYAAHRSHAYQWLSRTRLGHAGVTWLAWGWNLLVLAPAAYLAASRPELAPVLAVAAMALSAMLVLRLGAGRAE
jgi:Fuc2NAc and GlcNAc transferase